MEITKEIQEILDKCADLVASEKGCWNVAYKGRVCAAETNPRSPVTHSFACPYHDNGECIVRKIRTGDFLKEPVPSIESKWAIVYYGSEIGVRESYCKQPDNCTCGASEMNGGIPKCGYSLPEARNKIVSYYEKRAMEMRTMKDDAFLEEMQISEKAKDIGV